MFQYNITPIVNLFYRFLPQIGVLFLSRRQDELQKRLTNTPIVQYKISDNTNKHKFTYRTDDGSYNNLYCPYIGMKNQPFGRFMKPVKDTDNHPDPEIVAHHFFKRCHEIYVPKANLFVAAWIQFMIHDWFEHKVDETSPINEYGVHETAFVNDTFTVNEASHFWDGSQIYKDSLRMKDGSGKIAIGDDGYLPLDINGKEDVGNGPNRWYGLMLLHLLFTREHNYICDILSERYPDFDDDKIYGTARLIVTAIIAKIHTIEWTPTIVNNPVASTAQRTIWYGLLGKDFKKLLKLPNEILSGYPQGDLINQNVNFSHIVEFSSIYRMHSLLPESVTIADDTVELKDTLFDHSVHINTKYSQNDLFSSMISNKCCSLDLFNYPNFLRNLKVGDQTIDLAVIDIYRDRERMLPRYNEFRRNLLLSPIKQWSDLTSDKNIIARLKLVYNNDVEQLDLLVGTHIEQKLPGSIFGETIYSVFLLHTTRRITNDRFLTTDFTPELYTPFGMEYIDNTGFRDLLTRHYPELNSLIPENAFLLPN